jgi:hypothetical protein
VNKSDKVSGALIPVACGTKNINVEIPLLYALQSAIISRVSSLKKEINDFKQEIKKYEKEARDYSSQAFKYREKSSGFGGQVRDWWKDINGETTYAKLATQEGEKADKKWEEAEREKQRKEDALSTYNPLASSATVLESHLQKLPHIKQSKTVSNYLKEISRVKP